MTAPYPLPSSKEWAVGPVITTVSPHPQNKNAGYRTEFKAYIPDAYFYSDTGQYNYSCFMRREENQLDATEFLGWVGPRAGLDGRKISSPPGFDPGPPSL